jgi:hypothetical protein
VTAAAVAASTPVETSASIKASAKARPPARGEASRGSSMIKATERAGVRAAGSIERVVIDENSAVGDVGVVCK